MKGKKEDTFFDTIYDLIEEHKVRYILSKTKQKTSCFYCNRLLPEEEKTFWYNEKNTQEIIDERLPHALKTYNKWELVKNDKLVVNNPAIITILHEIEKNLVLTCESCKSQEMAKKAMLSLENITNLSTSIRKDLKSIFKSLEEKDIPKISQILTSNIKNDGLSELLWKEMPYTIYYITDNNLRYQIVSLCQCIFQEKNLSDNLKKDIIITNIISGLSDAILWALSHLHQNKSFIFHTLSDLDGFQIPSSFFDELVTYNKNNSQDGCTFLIQTLLLNKSIILKEALNRFQLFDSHIQEQILEDVLISEHPIIIKHLLELYRSNDTRPWSLKVQDLFNRLLDYERDKERLEAAKKEETDAIKCAYEQLIAEPQSDYSISAIIPDLIKKYRPIIAEHIDTYRDQFERYFDFHLTPLVAFDIEEYKKKLLCILAIRINPDLKFEIKCYAVDKLHNSKALIPEVYRQFQNWLSKIEPTNVLTHGRNEREAAIIMRSKHTSKNTQAILEEKVSSDFELAQKIGGVGLRFFERYVHFHRQGCSYLKHKISDEVFFQETYCSYHYHARKMPQRICLACNRPQDIFLYCLEDAFACILIEIFLGDSEPETHHDLLIQLQKGKKITIN